MLEIISTILAILCVLDLIAVFVLFFWIWGTVTLRKTSFLKFYFAVIGLAKLDPDIQKLIVYLRIAVLIFIILSIILYPLNSKD